MYLLKSMAQLNNVIHAKCKKIFSIKLKKSENPNKTISALNSA